MPGYPVDRRLKQRVASLRAGPVGDFEYMAARVMARLTGEVVILQDDGSQDAMADIRIEYAHRPVAYAEVWADVDSGYAGMVSRLSQRGQKLPAEFRIPGVHRDWFVTVSGKCHVGRLEGELPGLLSALESRGLSFELVSTEETLRLDRDPGVRRLVGLGVVGLASRTAPPRQDPSVRLYPSGITGPASVTWDPLKGWLKDTLASSRLADVRRKIARTGASERHVFLGLTFSSPGDVYFALDISQNGLPDRPPWLPSEITHVWIMAAEMPGRCLAWSPDQGWFDPVWHWKTD